MRSSSFIVVSMAVLLVACSDDGETDPGTAASAGTGTGTGDTGSPASTGPGGQGGDTAQGTGGAGGEGGGGEGGAGGEGGGAPGACLDPATHEALFAIDVPELCAVAVYDAPALVTEQYGALPTWGRHGGLLVGAFSGTELDAVDLHRFTAPAGASGELEVAVSPVDLGLGADRFAGAQILDLPWSDRSAFTYTGADFMSDGGLVLIDDEALVVDIPVIGGFGVAALPAGESGRVVVTALGPLDADASTPGLYAGDGCAEPDELCDAGAVAMWGEATGPVAADADGNVFALMTSFDGSQEARGWTEEEILSDEAQPRPGATILELDGFGSPFAAMAPAGEASGMLAFQPADATTFAPVEPIVVRYAVEGGAIAPQGDPQRLLDLEDDQAPVSLTTDDLGRLWVGVPSGAGTRFVVLDRAP